MRTKAAATLPFTPEAIASAETLRGGLDISPDGTQVIYSVRPQYKAPDQEHATSAIWIAEVDKEDSARQLTSGTFNDSAMVFSPDGQSIYFLSDRHKVGHPNQIYNLPFTVGGHAVPVTSTNLKTGVALFKISPDGKYIAFTSADEPNEEQEQKNKRKDDAIVFRDEAKGFSRLRLHRLATRTTVTFSLPRDAHVQDTVWNPDSHHMLVTIWLTNAANSTTGHARFFVVSTDNPAGPALLRATTPRSLGTFLTWLADDTALLVNYHSKDTAVTALEDERVVYAGVDDCAGKLIDLGGDSLVAVEVYTGLDSHIDVLDSGGSRRACVYQTENEAIADWAIKRRPDGSYVFVALRSSGPRKQTWNIWTGVTDGTRTAQLTKVSAHGQSFEDVQTNVEVAPFYWTSRDGTRLNGVIYKPNTTASWLPTLLVIHGGPYYRDTPSYSFVSVNSWAPFLSAAGFCCICPNYRGSSGRGAAFAETQRGGAGTVDWADCEDMLRAVLERGIADPDRLGICGWSQGGFMTAFGVSQTKNIFKAACVGAGITHSDSMATDSDMPDMAAEYSLSPPWNAGEHHLTDPISQVKDVETPVLLLHGEKDDRAPLGQAMGFYRGLLRMSKFPERHELVVYPREGHMVLERSHVEDVLKRVLGHFMTWLS
ncbi:alpha/beta-hydrolase [Auriculariales sp. MPI-PUGE-AT-0066]|nr:alpha/beta-hydrolase [Auriculariales sp. MPI-PUGE-AT-0066]